MSAQEYIFTIRLDDGSQAEARTADPASVAKLRRMMTDPKWARRPVRVASAPGDVSGHLLADDTLAISLTIEGDVEGHTMTLRFPSAAEAKRLQQRLLVGGILAASIAVGAVGASQLAGQQAQVQPISGPAITAPAERVGPISPAKDAKDDLANRGTDAAAVRVVPIAPVDTVTPGSIDAQLRDSVSITESGSSSVISPAKDAKDDLASGTGATGGSTDEVSNESLGQRSVMPK